MELEDRLRDSLRAKAAEIPEPAERPVWVAPPLAAVPTPSSGRPARRPALAPVLAAAAVIVVALLAAVVVSERGGEGPAAETTAGRPYGAVLKVGVATDASPGPTEVRPAPTITVFTRRVDGVDQTLAVVAGSVEATSSLDSLPGRYSSADPSDERQTTEAEPGPDTNGLRIVRWTGSDGRSIAAARGTSAIELGAIARDLQSGGSVETAGPGAWKQQYRGADANPFAGGSGQGAALAYDVDGAELFLRLDPDAASPADFAWFVATPSVEQVGGRTVVLVRGEGTTTASWTTDAGVVTLSGPDAKTVLAHVDDVVIVDKDQWRTAADRVTKPGSHFGTGGIGD